jgi:hypothetical protein
MARRSVGADVATLWEADGDGNLHNTAMLGAPSVDVTIPRDFSASGARIAYRTGEPVFIRDAADSPALEPRLREHVGCASVHFQPIASEFGVRGVLALCWNEPHRGRRGAGALHRGARPRGVGRHVARRALARPQRALTAPGRPGPP